MAPLLMWLRRLRRVRSDTLYVEELPWFGRRIDLATLTTTRTTTAYELKLADNRRAIEQAAYNALSFDRSFVVTGTRPSPATMYMAERHAVGIIVIRPEQSIPHTVVHPVNQSVSGPVRKRLLTTLRDRGVELADV